MQPQSEVWGGAVALRAVAPAAEQYAVLAPPMFDCSCPMAHASTPTQLRPSPSKLPSLRRDCRVATARAVRVRCRGLTRASAAVASKAGACAGRASWVIGATFTSNVRWRQMRRAAPDLSSRHAPRKGALLLPTPLQPPPPLPPRPPLSRPPQWERTILSSSSAPAHARAASQL